MPEVTIQVAKTEDRIVFTSNTAKLQIARTTSPTPEKMQQALERIERNAQAQTRVVEDLIDISRRTGFSRFPVHTEDLDDVRGAVHVKQAFAVQAAERATVKIGSVMRLGVGGSVMGSRRCGLRAFARSASSDRLVAILYTQVIMLLSPRKPPMPL